MHGVRPTAAQYACQAEGSVASIQLVKSEVAPEPSERTTGMIGRFGIVRPGLSAAISGSSQLVTLLVKMSATVFSDSRRFVTRCPLICRLYMSVVPPATSGTYTKPREGGESVLAPSTTP